MVSGCGVGVGVGAGVSVGLCIVVEEGSLNTRVGVRAVISGAGCGVPQAARYTAHTIKIVFGNFTHNLFAELESIL